MYSKSNRFKRKKKDLSIGISAPVNTPLGIGLLAAPVVIPLIARVISSVYNKIRAHMNNRELMRQIQDGRLTERDLVQSFVNQFFSELPSKYVDLYRKQLRQLQTCNTFRELKRTYKEIGFANTVGMNTITKLESDYLRAVANRPKSISVNGNMALDSKPRKNKKIGVNGAITHDSMPWAHVKAANSNTFYLKDCNMKRSTKRLIKNYRDSKTNLMIARKRCIDAVRRYHDAEGREELSKFKALKAKIDEKFAMIARAKPDMVKYLKKFGIIASKALSIMSGIAAAGLAAVDVSQIVRLKKYGFELKEIAGMLPNTLKVLILGLASAVFGFVGWAGNGQQESLERGLERR